VVVYHTHPHKHRIYRHLQNVESENYDTCIIIIFIIVHILVFCFLIQYEYGRPPLHEPPGLFATGTISKTYIVGSNVTMHFEITASHRGYLEFRICPNNDVTKAATQDCLDQYLLSDIKTGGTKFYFYLHNISILV
jgi:hypothetical protein